jgi:hypothetical protein
MEKNDETINKMLDEYFKEHPDREKDMKLFGITRESIEDYIAKYPYFYYPIATYSLTD